MCGLRWANTWPNLPKVASLITRECLTIITINKNATRVQWFWLFVYADPQTLLSSLHAMCILFNWFVLLISEIIHARMIFWGRMTISHSKKSLWVSRLPLGSVFVYLILWSPIPLFFILIFQWQSSIVSLMTFKGMPCLKWIVNLVELIFVFIFIVTFIWTILIWTEGSSNNVRELLLWTTC